MRRQLMPEVKIIPSPVGALGLFGRSPLTEEVEAELPAAIWDGGFTIITDGRGTMLGVGHWRPRQSVSTAAAQLGVEGAFDDAPPYVMLNGAIPPGVEVPPAFGVDRRDPAGDARDDGRGRGRTGIPRSGGWSSASTRKPCSRTRSGDWIRHRRGRARA